MLLQNFYNIPPLTDFWNSSILKTSLGSVPFRLSAIYKLALASTKPSCYPRLAQLAIASLGQLLAMPGLKAILLADLEAILLKGLEAIGTANTYPQRRDVAAALVTHPYTSSARFRRLSDPPHPQATNVRENPALSYSIGGADMIYSGRGYPLGGSDAST